MINLAAKNLLEEFEDTIDSLLQEDSERNIFNTVHHASSAGRCFKMLKYNFEHREMKPLDFNVKIKLFQGILWHKIFAQIGHDSENILSELMVSIPELHVQGFLDKAIIDKDKKVILLYDLKTTASYAYSKRFGRTKKEKSGFQELQLATYGMGLEKLYPNYLIKTYIVWLVPDNGRVKIEEIDYTKYRKMAQMYWLDAEIFTGKEHDNLIPGETFGVPFESWECNYCSYSHICNSPFVKKDK
jgi:CRISPR/Cas system-associated protein endoribonuclease Cas2